MNYLHRPKPLPYVLEDRTGSLTTSDFDDIYDRIFFRVVHSQSSTGPVTMIYEMTRRASRHRDSILQAMSPYQQHREPQVLLEFRPDQSLGRVQFYRAATATTPAKRSTIEMGRWLRRYGIFAG